MLIKELHIEGFKSYAQPKSLHNFDPFFNAINGLNGTGKSNCLDAICFVLGQTSPSNFRVNSMTSLIYKDGNAGVTRATVRAIFDNKDKSQSPFGLEDFDEFEVSRMIMVGGKTKFTLNGVTKTATQIQDMYNSCRLNIKSGHFVIMQGRVMKVMNMKPMEVLDMIQETTGTKMYESKKILAEKTILKKEDKVRQLSTIINDDLTPTLEKLRKDRNAYIQYQKMSREIEDLNRRCIAYQVYKLNQNRDNSGKMIEDIKKMIDQIEEEKSAKLTEIKKIRENIEEQEKEQKNHTGENLKCLEDHLKNVEKELTDLTSAMKQASKEVGNVKKEKFNQEKELKNIQKQIDTKEKLLKGGGQMAGNSGIFSAFKLGVLVFGLCFSRQNLTPTANF